MPSASSVDWDEARPLIAGEGLNEASAGHETELSVIWALERRMRENTTEEGEGQWYQDLSGGEDSTR